MNKKMVLITLSVFFISSFSIAQGVTRFTWHGHSAFEIVTPSGNVLMIDPWLNNPKNPIIKDGADAVKSVKKLDYILVTHGHFDHVGDAVALARATKAKLVANFELGTNMARVLGYPENQMGLDTLGNVGGQLRIANGEITVTFTNAVHSSSLEPPAEKGKSQPLAYGGSANGFIIQVLNGPTFYHSGDTAYFEDMKLLSSNGIDVALINIGGHFGMEPDAAVKATQAVKAKLVIPHHFGTFPILTQSTGSFFRELDRKNLNYLEMKPGIAIEFVGKELKVPAVIE